MKRTYVVTVEHADFEPGARNSQLRSDQQIEARMKRGLRHALPPGVVITIEPDPSGPAPIGSLLQAGLGDYSQYTADPTGQAIVLSLSADPFLYGGNGTVDILMTVVAV